LNQEGPCWGLLFAALFFANSPAIASGCAAETITIRDELLGRVAADQAARQDLAGNPGSRELLERALDFDRDNTAYMRRLLAGCGWPERSKVGEPAAEAAWRLVQHADMDPSFQEAAALQLRAAVAAGEAEGGAWHCWWTAPAG
jgi:hypothetical protein